MVDESFVQFCQQATDAQLENILQKECDAGRLEDYSLAKVVAEQRGWHVSMGKRVA